MSDDTLVSLPAECLLPERIRGDRGPAEVALLAHVLLDEAQVARFTAPTLSAPAAQLLAILADAGAAAARAVGLTLVASIELAPWLARDDAVAQLAVALAERVDALTVRELAAIGPFAHVAIALGSRPRARSPLARRIRQERERVDVLPPGPPEATRAAEDAA